jgi:hypothetical protein
MFDVATDLSVAGISRPAPADSGSSDSGVPEIAEDPTKFGHTLSDTGAADRGTGTRAPGSERPDDAEMRCETRQAGEAGLPVGGADEQDFDLAVCDHGVPARIVSRAAIGEFRCGGDGLGVACDVYAGQHLRLALESCLGYRPDIRG